MGVPTYLVFTKDHAYALACQVDPEQLLPTIQQAYQATPREQVIEERRVLESHTMLTWIVGALQSQIVPHALRIRTDLGWCTHARRCRCDPA